MATNKYYPEEVLIEKLESGEYNWLDYINHHSEEWQKEYADFCQEKSMCVDVCSAEAFIKYKDDQLEQAMMTGEA